MAFRRHAFPVSSTNPILRKPILAKRNAEILCFPRKAEDCSFTSVCIVVPAPQSQGRLKIIDPVGCFICAEQGTTEERRQESEQTDFRKRPNGPHNGD